MRVVTFASHRRGEEYWEDEEIADNHPQQPSPVTESSYQKKGTGSVSTLSDKSKR